jgi:hypothetical protein
MNNSTYFPKHSPEILARFLVELKKLGAAYTVEENTDGWWVTVTGY